MKISIDIDCTPDEARRFLGLPDVAPMQERALEAMERRLVEAISSTDTATLVERWMPVGLQGLEQWQSLWAQLAAAATGTGRKAKGKAG
jgi:hypothetical protein